MAPLFLYQERTGYAEKWCLSGRKVLPKQIQYDIGGHYGQ